MKKFVEYLESAVRQYPQKPKAPRMIESEQLQLEAVKQNWSAIAHIKNPSEQVQLEAVKQNAYAIMYIKNPSPKVRELHEKLWLTH